MNDGQQLYLQTIKYDLSYMSEFIKAAKSLEKVLIAERRDFHRHPEVGYNEIRTSGIVAQLLDELGMQVQDGVGKTGVVG